MFTGIVEKKGTVLSKKAKGNVVRFRFAVRDLQDDMKIGDSLATNGVCLTIVDFGDDFVEVDVIRATLKATSLGKLSRGSLINFERSLRMSDRLGGHMVQGHVDGTGNIIRKIKKGKNIEFHIRAGREIMDDLISKGSITVDGISLTIQSLAKDSFVVAIIPHTLEETNMSGLKVGDTVNLEVDVLSKYVRKHVEELMKRNG
ncbi:MAG: riboflavin synthase [Candidatus Omnitrophica bacterium]|nr:riboflavin synthase [Candidatus Omnitrophota bacterium]